MKRSLCNSLLLGTSLALLSCGPGKRANTNGEGGAEPQRGRGGTTTQQEAPRHDAPDQERIDSVKQEKQRERDRQQEP
jgi:hypothetical protein